MSLLYSPAATPASRRSLLIAADGTSVRSAALCRNSDKTNYNVNNMLLSTCYYNRL